MKRKVTRLNQENVLAYLKRQTEPSSASGIRFLLDGKKAYPLARTEAVLERLERKGQVRRLAFGCWEYAKAEGATVKEVT